MKEKKFIIKYTLRTNGGTWYLIDTKGNVVKELTNYQIDTFIL